MMEQPKHPHVVVLTGAGISAESGLKTFRDSDGLWEGHRIEDVATPEGWQRNPALVLEFYNQRRSAMRLASPNAAHLALAALEQCLRVTVVTQNVDDLHERAGSTVVVHLHGELRKAKSSRDDSYLVDLGVGDIALGDRCPKGGQLRPHVVWFGEAVPMMEQAQELAAKADVFAVIGTSLMVYPAAGLVHEVRSSVPIFVVDPNRPAVSRRGKVEYIQERASVGVPMLVRRLKAFFT